MAIPTGRHASLRLRQSGVMVDAHTHPTDVAGNIVDAIGHCPTEFGNDKIVHANLLGTSLWPPFATGVLEVADQLLLLGVNRDRRFTCRERFLHPIVDVVELRVAIGTVRSLACLAIGLQTIIELCRSSPTRVRPIVWPMSRRPWLSLRRLLQVHSSGDCGSPRVAGSTSARRSSSSSRPSRSKACDPRRADASALHQDRTRAQFGQSTSDRAARDARGTHHRNNPAVSRRARLRSHETPPSALVEYRSERLEALANGRSSITPGRYSVRILKGIPPAYKI